MINQSMSQVRTRPGNGLLLRTRIWHLRDEDSTLRIPRRQHLQNLQSPDFTLNPTTFVRDKTNLPMLPQDLLTKVLNLNLTSRGPFPSPPPKEGQMLLHPINRVLLPRSQETKLPRHPSPPALSCTTIPNVLYCIKTKTVASPRLEHLVETTTIKSFTLISPIPLVTKKSESVSGVLPLISKVLLILLECK